MSVDERFMEQNQLEPVLSEFIKRFIREFKTEKMKPLKKNSFADYIYRTVPENIYNTNLVNRELYKIKGSVGQGNWGTVPWLAVFDKRITTTAQEGVYIVYLLSMDNQTLYMTLNQGCTELRTQNTRTKVIQILRKNAEKIREDIDARDFSTEEIHLFYSDDDNERPVEKVEFYEAGTIFAKAYRIDDIPEEEELRSDLTNMMEVYKEYASKQNAYSANTKQPLIRETEDSPILYDKNMILYGPPGTGKTYHTAIYAVAICEGKSIEEVSSESYADIMARYERLKKDNRVAFTTFHQSYGYEEFIEGIKPAVDEESSTLSYTIESGVFKRFCEMARKPQSVMITHSDRQVWSVRNLADASDVTFDLNQYIYDNGVIVVKDIEDGKRQCDLMRRMCSGDWVILGKKEQIDAVGVIEDDEPFELEKGPFHWARKVNWLAQNLNTTFQEIGRPGLIVSNFTIAKSKVKIKDFYPLLAEGHTNTMPYVFIIDEINRGNISKIFGELITLIEDTKRDGGEEAASAILPYSGEVFSVPENVYILGTMNTADRSIALMDTALRRRFQFVEMMPEPNVLRQIHADKVGDLDVAVMLETINERITFLFDREHTIGHASFTKLATSPTIETLQTIFEKSVLPLLQEYFYDDYQKIQLVLGDNAKKDTQTKFILDEKVEVQKIFKGSVDEVMDLPEKKYSINKAAFGNLKSYQEI